MSHIAIVRSSARTSRRKDMSEALSPEPRGQECFNSVGEECVTKSVSVISDSEDSNSLVPSTSRYPASLGQSHATQNSTDDKPNTSASMQTVVPQALSLSKIETIDDIEECLAFGMSEMEVLDKIENKWSSIMDNLDSVLIHLQECGKEITETSVKCLESLNDAVNVTCDKLDDEMRSQYHLITKCEDLATKLDAANTLREEAKALRKSVDTLDHLYKSRSGGPDQRRMLTGALMR